MASFLFAVGATLFIMAFVIYWLLKNVYLTFHLQIGYRRMKEHIDTDWLSKVKARKNWKDIYHLVVIPTYNEPLDVLGEAMGALKNSDYPKDNMIVVLAIEEAEGKQGREKADLILKEFEKDFSHFLITEHPKNLQGEIPGKGSNETWALRQVKKEIIDSLNIPYKDIIVSSFDADTIAFPKYFSCLTYHYITSENPLRSSFQPIPLFLNNIWSSPAISRVFAFSTTFWYLINQARPEKLVTFSSHSMSFQALVDVDFKQTNVVSDDSRIFWQCFLKYDGNYKVQPLYYPVSMDANVAVSVRRTIVQIYKQ